MPRQRTLLSIPSVGEARGAGSATGNFTKIVQRLPVKTIVAPDQPLARLLRVGMSVETTIHTRLADVVAAYRDPEERL